MTTLDLSLLGLKPGRSALNPELLNRIIETHRGQAGLTLRFAPGVYYFKERPSAKGDGPCSFVFENFRDLQLDGSGCRFVFSEPASGFVFRHCENLRLKNFTVCFNYEQALIGRATAGDAQNLEIEMNPKRRSWTVREGRLLLGQRRDDFSSFVLFDRRRTRPVQGRARFDRDLVNLSVRTLGDRRFVISSAQNIFPALAEDKPFVIFKKDLPRVPALLFSHCKNMRLSGLSGYGLPAGFIKAEHCEEAFFEDLRLFAPQEQRVLMSAGGAGLTYAGGRGKIEIRNSLFEAVWDEAVLLYGHCGVVLKVLSERELLLKSALRSEEYFFREGFAERIAFRDGDRLSFKGASELETAEERGRGILYLRFARPLRFPVRAGDWAENASRSPECYIANCVFRRGFAEGLKLSPKEALVENCRFQTPGASLISASGGRSPLRSGAFEKLLIRGCVFEDSAYLEGRGRAVIDLRAPLTGSGHFFHQQVRLENNEFRLSGSKALAASNTAEIDFLNNRVLSSSGPAAALDRRFELEEVGRFEHSCRFGSRSERPFAP